MVKSAIQIGREMRSVSRYVGVCAPDSVVDTSRGVQIHIQLRVVGVRQVRTMEIRLDMAILISWAGEVVGEPAGGRKVDCCSAQIVHHYDLGVVDGPVGRKLASSYGSHVRASGGVLWVENELVRAEAARRRTVAWERGHAVVT